jgi:D-alanyl-lipoteichoic acid acyltransferase DltB (MBOAT superfamily)
VIFTSWAYALFLPVVIIGYRLLHGRVRLWFLLGSSYLFYAAWDWRFLALIWVSTGVDYVVARAIPAAGQAERRRLVLASVVTNLGILGFFKYWDFFVESGVMLLGRAGLEAHPATLGILLPVGISFYTFQTLSYTIDVYRQAIEPERRLDVFATYVAFFPQLVAGPIERAHRLIPQLRDIDRHVARDQITSGLWLLGRGIFRKMAIADAVAPYADAVFADPAGQSRLGMLVGVVAFSLQIYGDFAGYTDMARGSAKLLGVELVHNFRQPYIAKSITEFWRRWHISLSDWLRDYLYIPLGGSRDGRLATYRNLMVTMLLGGLWHGAAWTFVVWGGLHGLYLAVERAIPARLGPGNRTSRAWAVATAALVAVTWIPFRAADFSDAMAALSALVAGTGDGVPSPSALTVVALATWLTVIADRVDSRWGDTNPLRGRSGIVEGLAYAGALVAVIVLSGTATVPFIYFQF